MAAQDIFCESPSLSFAALRDALTETPIVTAFRCCPDPAAEPLKLCSRLQQRKSVGLFDGLAWHVGLNPLDAVGSCEMGDLKATVIIQVCRRHAEHGITIAHVLLKDRTLGPRARAVMDAAPGCVLLAVIAPYFVSSKPADLVALALTAIAAARLPMLGTVTVAVSSAALLRHLVP